MLNDLAKDIEDMQSGVTLEESLHMSVLFHADDITILSESKDYQSLRKVFNECWMN